MKTFGTGLVDAILCGITVAILVTAFCVTMGGVLMVTWGFGKIITGMSQTLTRIFG